MATLRTIILWLICLASARVEAAALRGPFVSGNGFELRLECETNAVYLIERSTNLPNWNVIARDDGFAEIRSFTFTNNLSHAFFRARRTNEPIFQFAMGAKQGIDFSGRNLRFDSFDSGDTNYNDGFGHYTNAVGKWKDNGSIGCNHGVTNTLSAAGAIIYGRLATGPYSTFDPGSQGSVGDIAWVNDPANRGKIKPGWWTTNANLKFPGVILSENLLSATPPPGTPPNTVIDGVAYSMVLKGSPSGLTNYYRLASGQNLTGKIYIEGHVRLLVTDNSGINLTGTDVVTIKSGTNNSLHLYADITNVVIGGQGVVNNNTATQFYYFGTDRNTSLSFGGNGTFTGALYAPSAALRLNAGGGAVLDLSGAASAASIRLDCNLNFHFDENLLRNGIFR